MTRDLGPASLRRCCLVWLGVTSAFAPVVTTLAPGLGRAPELATAPFDVALVLACEAALLACAAWFWFVTGVVALDAARGRSGPRRGIPTGLRRALLATCGATLVGSLAVPVSAAPGAPSAGERPGPDVALVQGLPFPDRATAAGHVGLLVARHARTERRRPDPGGRTAVVRPGDTLWGLASRELGPGAVDAAIARRWRQVYRANRPAIGPDPDVIHPHQRLHLPRR